MIRPTRTQLCFGLSVLVARMAYRIHDRLLAIAIALANEGHRPASALPLPGATGRVVREYLMDDRD